jgi:sugar O-acyltransferase (sialic acid O-acetyltransferase NeuD family)
MPSDEWLDGAQYKRNLSKRRILGLAILQKVVIFGTGVFAEVAHFYLTHDSDYKVVAFTVDRKFIKRKHFLDLPLVPFESVQKTYPPGKFKMFIAVGYKNLNKTRAAKYAEAKSKGYSLITYISSRCVHWGDTKIGDNCFIFENQTIQPFVKIGNDVVIWSGNHIGHHSTIGDHCFISSHVVISGNTKIGSYCFLGVNATLRDGISIAEKCIIGAGALIMKDTKKGTVYIGKAGELYSNDSSKF